MSTWYNWSLGWSLLNEESGTGSGTLQKTYVGGMAEIAGSSPATGAYSYYMTDNLGSTRAVYNQSKVSVAEFAYTPYGQAYAENDTIGITHRYTGHDWDATANLYFAPYRFYNPQLARWMSRDPLGMVDGPNVYAYIVANPIAFVDPEGTFPVWVLFRIAAGIVGVYAAANCVACLYRAADLAEMAFSNLPFDEAWDWFCKAKPGTECGPICGMAVVAIMTAFIRTGLRLPTPKKCC